MRATTLLALLALALVAGPRVGAAIDLLAESPVVFVQYSTETGNAGPVLRQNRTFQVRCNQADWGSGPKSLAITFADGRRGRFNITCGRPYVDYSGQYFGYIPRTGQLSIVEACRTIGSVADQPSGKHIQLDGGSTALHARRRAKNRAVSQGFGFPGSIANDFIGGFVNGAICTASLGALAGCRGGENPRDGMDPAIADLQAANREVEARQEEFHKSLENVQRSQANLTRALGDVVNQTLEAVDAALASQLTSLNISGKLAEHEVRQAAAMDAVVSRIDDELDGLGDNLNQLAGQVAAMGGSIDLSLRRAMNYTRDSFDQISMALLDVKNITSENIARLQRKTAALALASQRTIALLTDVIRQDDRRVQITRLIHEAIDSQEGLGFVPFLEEPGRSPDPTVRSTVEVDNLRITYALLSGLLVRQDLALICSSRYLLSRIDISFGPEDIIRRLGGPVSCDPEQASTCWCFTELTTRTCTRNVALPLVNASRSDTINTFCTGGVTTGAKQILTTYPALQAGLFVGVTTSPTAALAAGTRVYIASSALAKLGSAPPDPGLTEVANAQFLSGNASVLLEDGAVSYMERALFPPPGAPLNPFLAIFTLLATSRLAVIAKQEAMDAEVNGEMPVGGITFTDIPHTRRRSGPQQLLLPASCTKFEFMSFGNCSEPGEALRVARLTPVTRGALVTSTIEVLNSQGVALQVLSNTVTRVDLNMGGENLLPGGEYLTAGDLGDSSLIYNLPSRAQAAGESPIDRAGTPFYNVANETWKLNSLEEWQAIYGNQWNSVDAAVTADLYEASLSPNGTCTGPLDPGDGALCNVLGSFTRQVTQSANTYSVRFSARTGSYIATVNAPEPGSNLIAEVVSACPDMQLGFRSSFGVEVLLQASAALRGAVVAYLDVVGPCTNDVVGTTVPISLAPGQQANIWVPACVEPGEISAFLFHADTAGELRECGTVPFNATADVEYYRSVQGVVDTGLVYQVTEVNVNRRAAEASQLQLLMGGLVSDLVLAFTETFVGLNLPMPPAVDDRLGKILEDLVNLANRTNSTYNEREAITSNFTEEASALLSDVQAQTELARAQLANATAALVLARAYQGVVEANLNATLALIGNLSDAARNLEAATRAQNNATVATFNTTVLAIRAMARARSNGGLLGGLNGLGDFGLGSLDGVLDVNEFFDELGGALEFGVDLVEDGVDLTLDTANNVVGTTTDLLGLALREIKDVKDVVQNGLEQTVDLAVDGVDLAIDQTENLVGTTKDLLGLALREIKEVKKDLKNGAGSFNPFSSLGEVFRTIVIIAIIVVSVGVAYKVYMVCRDRSGGYQQPS